MASVYPVCFSPALRNRRTTHTAIAAASQMKLTMIICPANSTKGKEFPGLCPCSRGVSSYCAHESRLDTPRYNGRSHPQDKNIISAVLIFMVEELYFTGKNLDNSRLSSKIYLVYKIYLVIGVGYVKRS